MFLIVVFEKDKGKTGAGAKASDLSASAHYIGESYGGGIVFYVNDSGRHGLIAATSDQSTGMRWDGLSTEKEMMWKIGNDNAEQICASYLFSCN